MMKKCFIVASLVFAFSASAETPSQTAIWKEYKPLLQKGEFKNCGAVYNNYGAYDWEASEKYQDKRITALQRKRDNYNIPDIFNPPAEFIAIREIVQLALMQCSGDDIDLEDLDSYVE